MSRLPEPGAAVNHCAGRWVGPSVGPDGLDKI